LSFLGRVDAGSKGGFMTAETLKDKINLSHAKALRRSREQLKVTRIELARRLNLSPKAVEKYESGRAVINEEKINKWLQALEITHEHYLRIKKGKGIPRGRKIKTVIQNSQRRSYQRIITKEVRVLKILRQMKNLTQDQASAVCGYSRPSIGHIENGRISLDKTRIEHIIESYGFKIYEFERQMKEEVLRDEVLKDCYDKLSLLPNDKMRLVHSMIVGLS